jgi:agmatine deiminase
METMQASVEMTEKTPRQLDYRMPAEWGPHAATWIAWPHNPNDWPGKFSSIAWVYADIVRYLSRSEDVHIVVDDDRAEKRARNALHRRGVSVERLHFHQWPTNRVWTRDSGPIFVANSEQRSIAVTNWKFNAWAKYDDWELDDQLPHHVAAAFNLNEWQPAIPFNDGGQRIVLEGGSIDVNGAGLLLTTEECLLSEVQQRNPGVSRQQLESAFSDFLGIDKVLWMNRGCAGDDTHGHIDDVTRFVGPNIIVTATETNKDDDNHQPLQENLERLHEARNLDGQPFRIIEMPMPSPVVFAGQRLPASYCNFYIANDLVLVPTFNDANDRIALNKIAEIFPERRIVGIYCGDLIWGLGAIHCMTQQQPAI